MEEKKNLQQRSPIVVVLGHVDHGKTTLLDKIRNTNTQVREAGGITQTIGASTVSTKEGRKITFIDTPGHAAFSKMRLRGASVADIAVLVVAADDGVKPQTAEALEYIKEVNIPFVVAFSKIDLASSAVDRAINQLENLKVSFEGKGGNTPYVKVSGKTGEGIEELLETICLVADVNEIKGDESAPLEAYVIETKRGKGGPLASVVVEVGTLEVGDSLYSGDLSGKVKGLTDTAGSPAQKVLPGGAAQILGFPDIPEVGSLVTNQLKSEGELSEVPEEKYKQKDIEGKIPLYLKADSFGVLEAIKTSLPEKFLVVYSAVGDVGESDVLSAKSSNADIFTFNVKTTKSVINLAESEGVNIENFNIIYKLLERADEIIKAKTQQISGKAEIIATFPFNKQKVAGCKVLEGTINKTDKVVLKSEGKEVGTAKITSMKKVKQDIASAGVSEEFGVILDPQLDFKVGDTLASLK